VTLPTYSFTNEKFKESHEIIVIKIEESLKFVEKKIKEYLKFLNRFNIQVQPVKKFQIFLKYFHYYVTDRWFSPVPPPIKWPPWYNWNIVESGIKHRQANKLYLRNCVIKIIVWAQSPTGSMSSSRPWQLHTPWPYSLLKLSRLASCVTGNSKETKNGNNMYINSQYELNEFSPQNSCY
jgi:hypothetical protein